MTGFQKNTVSIISILALMSALLIFSYNSADSSSGPNMGKAKKLYIKECSKCHRKTGKGIKRVYPPLKNADYIKKSNTQELLRGMLFGRSGKIKVNGQTYNGVMTTEIDKSMRDKDIALILTYIYREFNDIGKTVSAEDVAKARKAGKLPPHND